MPTNQQIEVLTMPTDTKLREALAKMLPERVFFNPISGNLNEIAFGKVTGRTILDTELLQLCWDVEETLINLADYHKILLEMDYSKWPLHATWQKRVIALCKLKGIEIV